MTRLDSRLWKQFLESDTAEILAAIVVTEGGEEIIWQMGVLPGVVYGDIEESEGHELEWRCRLLAIRLVRVLCKRSNETK